MTKISYDSHPKIVAHRDAIARLNSERESLSRRKSEILAGTKSTPRKATAWNDIEVETPKAALSHELEDITARIRRIDAAIERGDQLFHFGGNGCGSIHCEASLDCCDSVTPEFLSAARMVRESVESLKESVQKSQSILKALQNSGASIVGTLNASVVGPLFQYELLDDQSVFATWLNEIDETIVSVESRIREKEAESKPAKRSGKPESAVAGV